jgi:hypothetical protein
MSAPACATAGVAFRLPAADHFLDEKSDQRVRTAAWWSAHVDLLRRLLAAQPTADYVGHAVHLTALERGTDWLRYFRGEVSAPTGEERVLRENMEAALADFGPPGHYFGPHPDHHQLHGWWPQVDNRPWDQLSGLEVAARFALTRRVMTLADQEAELPPPVEGTPALPQARLGAGRRRGGWRIGSVRAK